MYLNISKEISKEKLKIIKLFYEIIRKERIHDY